MEVLVLPVEVQDLPRLADIHHLAFASSSAAGSLSRDVAPQAPREHSQSYLTHVLNDSRNRLVKAVRGGKMVGWALWEFPAEEGQKVEGGSDEDTSATPGGAEGKELESLCARADLNAVKEPHVRLRSIFVDPSQQRTGVGRALLEWGIKQADEAGKDIYLAASSETRSFFPKFGFSHFGSPLAGGTDNKVVVYPMRRPARRLPATLPPPIPPTNGNDPSLNAPSPLGPLARSLVDVLPATSADLSRLATVQGLAFRPSAISRLIFSNVSPSTHLAHSTKRLQKALDHPYKAVYKAVLRETGEIVGMALWELPKPEGYEEEEEKREFPEGTNVELAKELFGRLAHEPGVPNYHLTILAIDPEKQRTGAGAALLRWGCKKADEEGLPMYLEATDVGVPLYARYAFKMDRPPIAAGVNDEIILYPMTRPALTLSPLTRSEIPLLPRIWHDSFRHSNAIKYAFSGVASEAFGPWVSARLEGTLDRKEKGEGKGDVILAKRGGDVVGFALYSWYPAEGEREKPPAGEKREKKSRLLPEGANVEKANRWFDMLEAQKASAPEAHYSLDNLCILPSAQRGGVGKALTLALMEKARAEDVSVTLESFEGGVPLYTHLGFKPFAQPLRAPDLPDVDLAVPMRWTPGVE